MPARTRVAASACALLLLMGARHPMHTAVTEITCDRPCPQAGISIRVFADDFGGVVSGTPGSPAADSAMSRYIRAHLTMADGSGRPLELRWSSARRDGDVILLRLRAPAAAACPGARVRSAILTDRFPDQINIVRASCGSRPVTLLFTPGDGAKALQ
jgi:hypothetical protein